MSKRDPLVLLEDIARNLEIIGEAARQLPEGFRRVHTEIPWSQIAGLRNRIVHDYFGLDLEIIWEIIQHDLPELEKQVRILQT